MFKPDDFQYAMENTQVILAPARRIETFGSVNFHFYLVSELMDAADQVRVRQGDIEAARPEILTPANAARLLLDGFGEPATEFASWLERQRDLVPLLKYGFQFKKSNVTESVAHNPLPDVLARVRGDITPANEPLTAIIQGVEDAWEVCLMKFTMDLVQQSAAGNYGDFRRRGLI
jgi:hypothetical protein